MDVKEQIIKFKSELKQHREQLKLSGYMICKPSYMPTWGNYEAIERNGNPTLKTLIAVAKGLDLTVIINDGIVTTYKNK